MPLVLPGIPQEEGTVEVEIKSRDFTAKQEEERGELSFKCITNDGSPTNCAYPFRLHAPLPIGCPVQLLVSQQLHTKLSPQRC